MKTWMLITFCLQVFWSFLVGAIVATITKNGPATMGAMAITACVVLFGMLIVYGLCKTAADAGREDGHA